MKASRTICVAAAFVVFAAAPALADVFQDGAYHGLAGTYSEVSVYNNAQDEPTMVELVAGGRISDALTVWQTSSAVVSGGTVNDLAAYDSGRVTITGGYITALWPVHSSRVDISGGLVDYSVAFHSSVLDISDGEIGYLETRQDSKVIVSGGNLPYIRPKDNSVLQVTGGDIGQVSAWNSSMTLSGGDVSHLSLSGAAHLSMSGGSIGALWPNYMSTADISGGYVSKLYARGTTGITLHGYDFVATSGLTLSGDKVLGIGTLTGKWLDGTAWTMRIVEHDGTATISTTATPEPTTLGLLALGSLAMLRRRQRKPSMIS